MSCTHVPSHSMINTVLLFYVRNIACGASSGADVRYFNFEFLRALRASLGAGSRLPNILGVPDDVGSDLLFADDDDLDSAVASEKEPILTLDPQVLSYLNECLARGNMDLCRVLLRWPEREQRRLDS